jgi:acylphosphatase
MPDESTAKRVIYHGRVQGVGFRYTTHRIAKQFGVTGFVRNLSDGTVELVVHGEADDVCRFLAAVGDKLEPNIRLAEETDVAVDTEFTRFQIRR